MDPEYDGEDIFNELSTVLDPEKRSYTLADLDVVAPDRCSVTYGPRYGEAGIIVNAAGIPVKKHQRRTATVRVVLKPTVPHCHLMMLIGLSVRAKLLFDLPRMNTTWRIQLSLLEGSHQQEADITKQINDKERVCAALENPRLLSEIQKLINPMEFVC